MRIRLAIPAPVWFSLVAATSVTSAALLAATAASSGEKASVAVAVEGAITASCSLTGKGAADTRSMTIGDINSGSFEYGYDIQCNTPFKYSIESQNGALALEAQAAGMQREWARLPYVLAIHIPTDDVVINDRCPSETIKAGQASCQFQDSRNGIAIDGRATLSLAWTPNKMLPAGTYSDRLTFSVGVRQ